MMFDGVPASPEAKQKIDALDLEPIKFKLIKEDGWTLEQADAAEPFYKGYLLLTALYPDQPIVPNKVIDKMWHTHILDTQKYAEDCQNIFGRFVHHFPYFGVRGYEDKAEAESAFAITRDLFSRHVGIPMDDASRAFSNGVSDDWSLCSNNPDCNDSCDNRTSNKGERPNRKDTMALNATALCAEYGSEDIKAKGEQWSECARPCSVEQVLISKVGTQWSLCSNSPDCNDSCSNRTEFDGTYKPLRPSRSDIQEFLQAQTL